MVVCFSSPSKSGLIWKLSSTHVDGWLLSNQLACSFGVDSPSGQVVSETMQCSSVWPSLDDEKSNLCTNTQTLMMTHDPWDSVY